MRRFKSMGQAQRIVTAHAAVSNLFNLGRHLPRAQYFRDLRTGAFSERSRAVAWDQGLVFFGLEQLTCRYPPTWQPCDSDQDIETSSCLPLWARLGRPLSLGYVRKPIVVDNWVAVLIFPLTLPEITAAKIGLPGCRSTLQKRYHVQSRERFDLLRIA